MTQFSMTPLDLEAADRVMALHRAVAASGGGLARQSDEISRDYVNSLLEKVRAHGVSRGAWMPDGSLAGEIHAHRMAPRQFHHVLTDLTIAVHPNWQGKGLGTMLFKALIEASRELAPPISRIELFVRSGNVDAIRLYERLGFVIEGYFKKRVRLPDGRVEDDVAMALSLSA